MRISGLIRESCREGDDRFILVTSIESAVGNSNPEPLGPSWRLRWFVAQRETKYVERAAHVPASDLPHYAEALPSASDVTMVIVRDRRSRCILPARE
jgi:hypothetical protein